MKKCETIQAWKTTVRSMTKQWTKNKFDREQLTTTTELQKPNVARNIKNVEELNLFM